MRIFKSSKKGLEIIVRSDRTARDVDGFLKTEPGLSIQFHDGIFKTDDKVLLDKLEEYMRFNQNEVFETTEGLLQEKQEAVNKMAAAVNRNADKHKINRKITIREEE